jgi:hypothetical protein
LREEPGEGGLAGCGVLGLGERRDVVRESLVRRAVVGGEPGDGGASPSVNDVNDVNASTVPVLERNSQRRRVGLPVGAMTHVMIRRLTGANAPTWRETQAVAA